MDQDSFRRLLASSAAPPGAASRPRPRLAVPPPAQSPNPAPSQPAFKPRNVRKPANPLYRDRAAERRGGSTNDYAHVEAVLEDFERKHADDEDKAKVDAQRRYLGGDSEHSILVKGLDFALLEQNKARAAAITLKDVDALEQAFLESHSNSEPEPAPPVSNPRTRDEILQDLKRKRTGAPATHIQNDVAPNQGKFKPVGFKPIGSDSTQKKKKKKRVVDGENKKKSQPDTPTADDAATPSTSVPPPPLPSKPIPEPASLEDDLDIFAGVEEYQGIDIGSDDEDETRPTRPADSPPRNDPDNKQEPNRRWIEMEEDRQPPPLPNVSDPNRKATDTASSSKPQPIHQVDEEHEQEDGEVDVPMRLVPLESSAMPSIKDLLEMDKAASAYDKKRKRKDKKKGGGGPKDDDDDAGGPSKKKSADAKLDRDYKRLKTYTDKKSAT